MLFTSPVFLFAFLPLVLAVYYFLDVRSNRAALYWLLAASLIFYGWWNPGYLLLIGSSITVNFLLGMAIQRTEGRSRRLLLTVGVTGNLLCIGYFKYAMFLAQNINDFFGTSIDTGSILLPLAISFFTFQQIAYLVDTYRAEVSEGDFPRYGLFVVFFPQLIAGPIVHHREMMPQFTDPNRARRRLDDINVGLTVFAIGLFKKVVLADTLGLIADPVFAGAEMQTSLSAADAWAGALAYTFQLYFDFSGYSDMALGLAILFGIRLPLNFFSPYKATSIIDFWRRWHITLSRFLRDYLYIPLGGNRKGPRRRHVNLMLTMLLGGLWHGAGWTFIIWGGLHGLFLVVNHGWRHLLNRMSNPLIRRANACCALPLTFFCVVIAWVYFRATTVDGAHHMLAAMLPFIADHSGDAPPLLADALRSSPVFTLLQPLIDNAASAAVTLMLTVAAFIAFVFPNTVEFMRRSHPALPASIPVDSPRSRWLTWQPDTRWAAITALLLLSCVAFSSGLSPFLYFQF